MTEILRKIVEIDEKKCDGCGICIEACHEGAIELIDGKAKLIRDDYCDGLGDCLPACPQDAIKIIERKAKPFDIEAVEKLQKDKDNKDKDNKDKDDVLPCGCPGTMSKVIKRDEKAEPVKKAKFKDNNAFKNTSQLGQWPIQMRLVNPGADYFKEADLLVAADCCGFAYGNLQEDFIKDKTVVIACPKLDDNNYNQEKLIKILEQGDIKSITVLKMSVPCCTGIAEAVKKAMLKCEKIVDYKEVTINLDGTINK